MIRADQNTGGAVLEVAMRTAMHGKLVCNKVRFFLILDDSGNCIIIRKTWLHCIRFKKKLKLSEVIPHCKRSVNCRLGLQHFNEYHAYEYSLMNKSDK